MRRRTGTTRSVATPKTGNIAAPHEDEVRSFDDLVLPQSDLVSLQVRWGPELAWGASV